MIKGILFDKDGTLIEFESVWHGIIGKILAVLEEEYHFSKEVIETIKQVSGYQENNFTKESIIQYYATSQIAETWFNILSKETTGDTKKITFPDLMNLFEIKALDESIEINSVAGAKELLDYLANKNYILGLVTADTLASTVFSLKKAGVLHYFKYIGCNEEGIAPKPAPDMAVIFSRRMNLKPDEILMIGDSFTDLLFAENAGMGFIGIKTAYNDYQKFSEHNKLSVDKIDDIIIKLGL